MGGDGDKKKALTEEEQALVQKYALLRQRRNSKSAASGSGTPASPVVKTPVAWTPEQLALKGIGEIPEQSLGEKGSVMSPKPNLKRVAELLTPDKAAPKQPQKKMKFKMRRLSGSASVESQREEEEQHHS